MQKIDTELVEQRFNATAPRTRGKAIWYALLAVLAVTFFVSLQAGQESSPAPGWLMILPWCAFVGMLAAGWVTGRRQRQRRRLLREASEHAQLEAWDALGGSLGEAMQRPIQSPHDRCQAFMLLAAGVEHDRDYDVAAQIYERLLLDRIGDGYQLQQAQLALSDATLRNDQLTDAVRMLDRLEKIPMPAALRAVYGLIRLYQRVFMGHNADAAEDLSDQRSLFRRYLSTRAGYGYGLLAAALHHLGRHTEAGELWRDATTLVPAARLVREYDLLAPLAKAYRAVEHPL